MEARVGGRGQIVSDSEGVTRVIIRTERRGLHAHGEMLRHKPRLEGGEEEGGGDATKEAAEHEDVPGRPVLGHAACNVREAVAQGRLLAPSAGRAGRVDQTGWLVNRRGRMGRGAHSLSASDPTTVPNNIDDPNPAMNSFPISPVL